MLGAYTDALRTAEKLYKQGKSPAEIDGIVKIDDEPALTGLDTLDSTLLGKSNGVTAVKGKPQFISALRRAMGYGGMIHGFKNLVLRHEHPLIEKIKADIAQAEDAIDRYVALGVNRIEMKALDDIRKILGAYGAAVATVDRMDESGASPAEIDRVVRINDSPALEGIAALTQQIVSQSDADARRMNEALERVTSVAYISVWATVAFVLILAAAGLWLIRIQIVRPITKMTEVMGKLSGGDLSVIIHATDQKNEIGRMARSVEVFKNTAIERIQSEAARSEQEKRYRMILDNAADGVITVNEQGIIELFNPAAEKIFGYSADEMIGQGFGRLVPAEVAGTNSNFLNSFTKSAESEAARGKREIEGRRRDGTRVQFELAVSELKLGDRTLYTALVSDISERKKVEMIKNELVSTVSHELRTPLTSIRGALGLIESGKIDDQEKVNDLVRLASKNTDRLINLVNDLLDMEKLHAGKMEFDFSTLEIGSIVSKGVELNESFAQKYGVRFEFTQNEEEILVNGDSDRLIQVLSNLLSNATKFSPPDGTVDIGIQRCASGVRVSIADYGPGIPNEFREQIFERFTQVDSSDSRQKGGTGLGLSISKIIVEKHGGEIGFESILGRGTTFYFELPESGSREHELN